MSGTHTAHTVGVVGAGITGLAVTHYLTEQGVDVRAFEASDQPGGVICSREVDGQVLEAGPQRMRKTPGVAALAADVGVAESMIEARAEDLYVYADGSLGQAPLSIDSFLSTDLLSWTGKTRMLAEPLTRPGMAQETAEDLFVRKFGREAYEKFIGPLYGGIYGSDPAEMPAAYALDGLMKREADAGSFLQAFRQRVSQGSNSAPVTFEQGNQQLPRAIYEHHDQCIDLETPVTGIERVERTGADGPFLLHTPEETHEVAQVVLTTPAPVTAELLDGLAAGVAGLGELQYNPLALVFLDSSHDRTGKGYQVSYGADLHTLGVSWNAQMFGRDGVQTVFLGGMHEPELVEESDETLGKMAREEFEQVVGADASVIDVARLDTGFPAWDHSWWSLEELKLPHGITLATNYTARMGIPSRVREAKQVAEELADEQRLAGTPSEREPALAND